MAMNRRRFLEMGSAALALPAALVNPASALTGAGPAPSHDDGLYWPSNQALPSFLKPVHLDYADIQNLTGDQQVLLTTLQGIVNRQQPRLYFSMSNDNSDQAWLTTFKVPYTTASDPLTLIDCYRHLASGAIVYDPDVPDTINVATTLASLRNAVVASADLAAQYQFPVFEDLRGVFTNKLDAYNWVLDKYWPSLTHRILTGISPANRTVIPSVPWTTLLKVTQPVTDGSNTAVYTADLTPLLGTGSVYVRYQDAYPSDGWGPSVSQVTVLADGNTIASFQPGTAAETPFLYEADNSSLASGWRFADGSSFFIYVFNPPPGTKKLTLQTEMWNEYYVDATNTAPLAYVPVPNFRDYIIATKAFVFWLDPLVAEEAALFSKILQQVQPDTPYLGWFVGGHEDPGVTLCAKYGVPVGAADFFNNGTVIGGILASVMDWQPPVRLPKLEPKVYVTLTMSEGDNLQYVQHRMRDIWDDPNRGKTPLNWSISPLLLDAGPALLKYFQQTQTKYDFFVAGPSGAGYTYPGDWPLSVLPGFTRKTGQYMRRMGLDVIYALNRADSNDIALSPAVAQQYMKHVHPLLGILYNWESQSQLTTPAGLPVFTQIGISSVSDGQNALTGATANWNRTSPLFVALGVLAWNMTPTDVNTLAGSLPLQYELVRGDTFFSLLRKTLGRS